MTYDPLTDDILLAVEAAHARSEAAEVEGEHSLAKLLSGFDLNPVIMAELVDDAGKNHSVRLKSGAPEKSVLQAAFTSGLLIGLMLGHVREARRVREQEAA